MNRKRYVEQTLGFRVVRTTSIKATTREATYQFQKLSESGRVVAVQPSTPHAFQMFCLLLTPEEQWIPKEDEDVNQQPGRNGARKVGG